MSMKTREQIATDLYNFGRDSVMRGGDSLRMLATHIPAMVYGVKGNDGPLWQDRAFNDKVIHLDRFEDYLLKPARAGLGIPSLLWLSRVLDAHEDQAEREAAFSALRQEIPDFDGRVEKERAMASVRLDPAKPRGGTGANQYTVKDEKSKEGNSLSANKRKDGGAKSPERIIARLKRDSETDTQAASLLASIENGELKPYRAAIDMGWVKTPAPAVIIEKQREKLEPEDQVRLWEQWGRSLPPGAYDPLAAAKEALLNLNQDEARAIMAWWMEVQS